MSHIVMKFDRNLSNRRLLTHLFVICYAGRTWYFSPLPQSRKVQSIMSKNDPPPYGFVPPPSAPPSYAQGKQRIPRSERNYLHFLLPQPWTESTPLHHWRHNSRSSRPSTSSPLSSLSGRTPPTQSAPRAESKLTQRREARPGSSPTSAGF